MKPKHPVINKQNLLDKGAFAGMTAGNGLANRFCHAVEQGNAPSMDDLETVAYALEMLKDGSASDEKLREFADRLGVKRKQGKQHSTKADWMTQAMTVVRYYAKRDEYIVAGESLKDAQAAARALVASELGIKDRAMRNRIEQFGADAELMYSVLRPNEAT